MIKKTYINALLKTGRDTCTSVFVNNCIRLYMFVFILIILVNLAFKCNAILYNYFANIVCKFLLSHNDTFYIIPLLNTHDVLINDPFLNVLHTFYAISLRLVNVQSLKHQIVVFGTVCTYCHTRTKNTILLLELYNPSGARPYKSIHHK